ncbi:MAG: FecR domain-containing protein [Gammaproteobacteria bacterium]|nr:FecR domain-containing protein [Gammaproteobacteria bacterium]
MLTNVVSAASSATPIGKLDGLQLPAWLDRGGLTVPASPGIDLYAGDKLRTGKGARLLITLTEGSFVRLGENATFEIAAAQRKSGVYTAALNVLEGAFRFTTKALAKAQPRDVNIRIANNATIGIRGTDLWGRGRGDKDIVCLLEGKIDVTGNNNRTLRLDQPLQFFQSTRNAPPEPVGFVDAKQIAVWAKETDIEDGRGSRATGDWSLSVAGFASRNAMLAASRTLRDAGYPIDKAANNTLAITRLASEAEATALAAILKNDFSLNDIAVARMVAKVAQVAR